MVKYHQFPYQNLHSFLKKKVQCNIATTEVLEEVLFSLSFSVESSRQLSQLPVICCEWEWDVVRILSMSCASCSWHDHFTCRVCTALSWLHTASFLAGSCCFWVILAHSILLASILFFNSCILATKAGAFFFSLALRHSPLILSLSFLLYPSSPHSSFSLNS